MDHEECSFEDMLTALLKRTKTSVAAAPTGLEQCMKAVMAVLAVDKNVLAFKSLLNQ